MTDQEMANHIEREGSWERGLREAEAATIARNVARWHMEQEKRERRLAEEMLRYGLTKPQLKQFHAKVREAKQKQGRLRNCRATLAEIVQAHKKGSSSK